MNFTRKTTACLIFIVLAVFSLTSCSPKSYAGFNVSHNKAISGDYIILPDLTIDNDVLAVNPDKSYHFPLIMYKAMEAKLAEFANKFNDFSAGMTYTEANKLLDLFMEDYGAGLISDEKQKSKYYGIITDIVTKKEAKNIEATAYYNEIDTFTEMFSDVLQYMLDSLMDIKDFADKNDSYTIKHADLFTDDTAMASNVMAIWFPSVKFIKSFDEKTGPEIENPWIPDWKDLLTKMADLNADYQQALRRADPYDPYEFDAIIYDYNDMYYELVDIWYDLPDIEEYENQYDDLRDAYSEIEDTAYDMYDDAWYSYWNYYW